MIGRRINEGYINVSRDVLTGYNEAFIIDKEKKKKLIVEDPKSAEIIRPILRGRDIKRYAYEFADLYIIATFPSLKVNIDMYPSVKQHLMSFGYDRLKQTGDSGARKKTGNKWFETQDSISYWEDFNRQKIVWKRIGSIIRFSYDESGALALDSTCFATGKNIKYLVGILNSKFGRYLMKDSPQTGTGDLLISVQAIEPLLLKVPNELISKKFEIIIDQILTNIGLNNDYADLENEISALIYQEYHFTQEEIRFIESQ